MATICINDVSLFDGVAQLLLRGPQASVTGRGFGKSINGQRSGISVPPPPPPIPKELKSRLNKPSY